MKKTPSRTISKISAVVSAKYKKSPQAVAIENMDPLHGVNSIDAKAVFNMARAGSYARIQSIYNEIEKTDPTLLVCVNRRAAALSELDWKVVRTDERRSRGTDDAMVQAQIEYLETAIARIENLAEAIEHLSLAAFRGYSHVIPRFDINGEIVRFDLPDSWNFCYDRNARRWLWNPAATQYVEAKVGVTGLVPIPSCELVSVVEKRAIDWPALMIFLRSSVGETNWGRFLEQYGIPPVILTMPDGTSQDDAEEFVDAARDIFLGSSGAVPYGTGVSYSGESRGVNPFSEFIDHQQKLVVLMATGGLLTSLAESGSGTLAGEAHADTWKQIARRDSRIIANAIQRQLCERLIRKHFPGQPILAEFSLDTEPTPSAREVLEIANLAKSAGLAVDPDEISQRTGYTLTAAPEPEPSMGGFSGMNAEAPIPPQDEPAPVVANADQAKEPEAPQGDLRALAESVQADFRDVADRLNKLLALPDEERPAAAEKLIGELDGLVPDDPQMAEVIRAEMERVFEQTTEAAG